MLLGPIISCFFACSNEEKNKPKQQRVHALVLYLRDEQVFIKHWHLSGFKSYQDLARVSRVRAQVRDRARMAFLQRIDGLVPADLVSGKLKRLQVHDVDVSAVRADVNPFILVKNDVKPLFFCC